jgi:hypothetical protein
MLVPVPFVKSMRAIANHIRSHRHPFTLFRPRPCFRRLQQARTSPAAPCRFTHNKSVDLSPQRNLKQIRNAHVSPPDNLAIIFRDKNRIRRSRLHAPKSNSHLRRGRRIPKLTRKRRQPRNIARSSPPNFKLGHRHHNVGARRAFFRLQRVDVRPSKEESTTKMFYPNPAKSSPDLHSPAQPTSSSETRRSAHPLQAFAAPRKTPRTAPRPAPAAPPR